tara:strand:- start:317 stop:577 length:261 start_codon:yes stop_codon:yes gene_type:complete
MKKNILKFMTSLFVITFIVVILKYYFSEKNVNLLKNNKINLEMKISENISSLPTLYNDTNDVIEFNSGFENSENQNYKKNFWDLFK